MGAVFTGVVYVAGYAMLIFVAVCLASGLYYLAEVVEEYTSLTRRIMHAAAIFVLAVHALFAVFEEMPMVPLAVGAAAHGCYLWLLQSFPFLSFASPATLASLNKDLDVREPLRSRRRHQAQVHSRRV